MPQHPLRLPSNQIEIPVDSCAHDRTNQAQLHVDRPEVRQPLHPSNAHGSQWHEAKAATAYHRFASPIQTNKFRLLPRRTDVLLAVCSTLLVARHNYPSWFGAKQQRTAAIKAFQRLSYVQPHHLHRHSAARCVRQQQPHLLHSAILPLRADNSSAPFPVHLPIQRRDPD